MAPVKRYPPKPEKVHFFGTCLSDMLYPQTGLVAFACPDREHAHCICRDRPA